MKRHQFEQHARHFRSGRISLNQLIDLVFGDGKEVVVLETLSEDDIVVASVASEVGIPALKPRPDDAHKGDFGRVLLVGGSRGMAGAISLAAMSALRSGSGLVTAAVPETIAEVVAGFDPCVMTVPCRDSDGHFSSVPEDLKQQLKVADVVAIGPGMGREVDRYFLQAILELSQPIVIDADAIHLLAETHSMIKNRKSATVLTPHPGEFSNLANTEFSKRGEMEAAAVKFAADQGCIIVLKGHRTLVTDGSREYRNDTGNAGMATGGSGDVLTGVVTSLIGQGYDAFDAAVMAVHIHGRAGDFAAEKYGQASMVASNIVDSLAAAFKSHVAVGAEVRIGF
ncbi:NAD(P)H-hydrate dehydratase [Mariniblastus fucicola]|uniref:ADP-dependent (S)-NAD(P)H-hydrate dehydratase n=1 Tax=Mariniblastus fucicola TaxID=980251 RepID=A0A5B9PBS9_9BACT|nr:NAD(P)H-hydrate dehydratase [Mariniblastus fucicola]QEG23778.1 ATP-dependent (S)-NAD(P)H-hydrate dehydratase [Mariniblastus fucicola]